MLNKLTYIIIVILLMLSCSSKEKVIGCEKNLKKHEYKSKWSPFEEYIWPTDNQYSKKRK